MTGAEFGEVLKPLCGYYNKDLPAGQIEFWFSGLKRFSAKTLKKAVDTCRTSERYFPTMQVFMSHCENAQMTEIKPDFSPLTCVECSGHGIISAEYKNGRSYSFRCLCPKGSTISDHVPRWRSEMRGLKIFKSDGSKRPVSKAMLQGLWKILLARVDAKKNLFEISEMFYELAEKFPGRGLELAGQNYLSRWNDECGQ